MGETAEPGKEVDLVDLFLDMEKMTAAVTRGVHRALWRHKQLGQYVVMWENGRVVHVAPEDIDVEKPD